MAGREAAERRAQPTCDTDWVRPSSAAPLLIEMQLAPMSAWRLAQSLAVEDGLTDGRVIIGVA